MPGENRTAVAAIILAALAAVLMLGVLVVGRRLAGAVDRPAPPVLVATTAAAVGMLSWMSRRAWPYAASPLADLPGHRIMNAVVGWGPTLAIVLLAVGLSLPLARWVDWVAWLPLYVADFLWRRAFVAAVANPAASRSSSINPRSASEWDANLGRPSDDLEDGPGDGVLTQQLTRFRDPDGRESIAAVLRADFVAGQRTADLYIGFCPPFGLAPTVDVEQSDGPVAGVSTGQVLPHGARIEVRLSEPATDEAHVRVNVFANS